MITVILCGSEKDGSISAAMRRALQAYGGIPLSESPRFLLRECTEVPEMKGESGIFVFKNSFSPKDGVKFRGGCTPVMDAQNHNAAAVLKGADTIAITCGMSARDTLSIASLDYTSAVVSVQRNITTVACRAIEPHDFTVELKESTGVYPLLAACAVLLLSGVESGNGYCF